MSLMEEGSEHGGELLQRAQERDDLSLQVIRSSNRRFPDSVTLELIPNQLVGIELR